MIVYYSNLKSTVKKKPFLRPNYPHRIDSHVKLSSLFVFLQNCCPVFVSNSTNFKTLYNFSGVNFGKFDLINNQPIRLSKSTKRISLSLFLLYRCCWKNFRRIQFFLIYRNQIFNEIFQISNWTINFFIRNFYYNFDFSLIYILTKTK